MIKHVVLLNWKDGVTQDQIDGLTDAFLGLTAEIPQIKSYQFGQDLGLMPGNASYAIVAEFDSEQDLQAYIVHPAHQKILGEVAGPLLASFQAAQFTL